MENWENIQLPWQDWTITAYLGGGGYGKVYQIDPETGDRAMQTEFCIVNYD